MLSHRGAPLPSFPRIADRAPLRAIEARVCSPCPPSTCAIDVFTCPYFFRKLPRAVSRSCFGGPASISSVKALHRGSHCLCQLPGDSPPGSSTHPLGKAWAADPPKTWTAGSGDNDELAPRGLRVFGRRALLRGSLARHRRAADDGSCTVVRHGVRIQWMRRWRQLLPVSVPRVHEVHESGP